MVIQESIAVNSKAFEDAMEHLDKYGSQICDKLSIQESLGNAKFLFDIFWKAHLINVYS